MLLSLLSGLTSKESSEIDLSDSKRYRDSQEHKIIVSVDLGKWQDFTAFTICEVLPEVRTNQRNQRREVKIVHVRDIQRLPLGTPYTKVVEIIHEVVWDKRLWLIDSKMQNPVGPALLVDSGGVGEGVADDIQRSLGLSNGFIRYRLVRGTAVTKKSTRNYTVPRTVMFERLYAAFADDRIRINRRLKFADVLQEELRNLRPEFHEETGYERIVHREGTHDDLAITLAAANWYANRQEGRTRLQAVSSDAAVKRLGLA
jgi:hypothetical protein